MGPMVALEYCFELIDLMLVRHIYVPNDFVGVEGGERRGEGAHRQNQVLWPLQLLGRAARCRVAMTRRVYAQE